MATLDSFPLQYENRKVNAPKRSLLKRMWLALQMDKVQVQIHREERRALYKKLSSLQNPLPINRIDAGTEMNHAE